MLESMLVETSNAPRWELYRLLSEPARLRLLALVAAEELNIGELAELLDEPQPNVSRHMSALKKAELLVVRREGTRTFLRLRTGAERDPVVADALREGRALCEADGVLGRVHDVVRAREARAREFFARPRDTAQDDRAFPQELPAYVAALSAALGRGRLAVDAGTGDGRLLEVLAPAFDHVVALDRSEAQLARTRERLALRGHANVELVRADLDDAAVRERLARAGGADAVFASRILHHAAKPAEAIRSLARMLRAGGALIVVDYAPHEDESMRDEQADLWLGFDANELARVASEAGLADARCVALPASYRGDGPDRHLEWLLLTARKP